MTTIKLRIKHPSGAEFEAEGPADLIISEKSAFLSSIISTAEHSAQERNQPARQIDPEIRQISAEIDWADITENKENGLKLRVKHPEIKAEAAAIIIIAANRQLNNTQEISAITLSKALRKSGYQPGRIDRLLSNASKNGWIQASGTKRNRTYQATGRGLEIAWLEARKLTRKP